MLTYGCIAINNSRYVLDCERLVGYTKRALDWSEEKREGIVKRVVSEIPFFMRNPGCLNGITNCLHDELFWREDINEIPPLEAFRSGLAQYIFDSEFIQQNLRLIASSRGI